MSARYDAEVKIVLSFLTVYKNFVVMRSQSQEPLLSGDGWDFAAHVFYLLRLHGIYGCFHRTKHPTFESMDGNGFAVVIPTVQLVALFTFAIHEGCSVINVPFLFLFYFHVSNGTSPRLIIRCFRS